MMRCLLTGLALLLFALPTRAQDRAADEAATDEPDTVRTREVAVRADVLEGDIVDGEQIRRLIGDVHLEQEETRLWSNRALQYLDRREILFTGNVLVVERGDTLRADTVLYNSRQKTGRASGDVRLTDGEVVVRAPSGLYYTREKRAVFTEGVTLVDSSAILQSEGGEYWSDEKRAEFYGDVELEEDRTYLEADSVTYLRETDVSIARGDVYIERFGSPDEADADSLSRTLLFGDRAYNNDSTEYSRFEGQPLLVQLRQDSVGAKVDTLLIRAAILESSRQDSLRRLIAVDSVQIWRSEFAAVADSVVYDRISIEEQSSEQVRLYRDPLAWIQNNQVSGDTLRVQARDGSVDSLFVRSSAFVARMDSALQRVHQLRGQHLVATFEEDSLRTMSVGPQAEAIFYRGTEDDEPAGAVKASADRIVFFFEGDEVRRLKAIRNTENTYYTEQLMPEGLELEGFTWLPERRPTKPGLLRDVVIPTQMVEVALGVEAPY